MTTITLLLRPSSRVGRYPGSLSLRLIHNRRAKTVTLSGCRLYAEEWNNNTQEIIYPETKSRRTAQLERIQKTILVEIDLLTSHIQKLEQKGRYSIEDVIKLYHHRKDEKKLLGFAESLARDLEHNGQERTANAYRTIAGGIVKFNKGVDIPLQQINACLIRDFEKHLRDKCKMPNTISYYMRGLRAIFNKAVAQQRIPKPKECPFTDVYKGITKTMKRSLSPKEMTSFLNINLDEIYTGVSSNSPDRQTEYRLFAAWRYFVFAFCARGMCFVDLAYLRKDNVRGGFIRYVRHKTGQQIEVGITPELRKIIESFSRDVKGSPYVFPILNPDKGELYRQYGSALRMQNYYLKILAGLSGISKSVSTHTARHTWATMGRYNNLPISVISECLGHNSEKTTRIYLDSLENSILDAANDVILSTIVRPATRASLYCRM